MGSNPVRVITNLAWRITQVAEGNGLENRQVGLCRREGSNPSFSFTIIAGWSSLVARRLITRRSQVQTLLPQFN